MAKQSKARSRHSVEVKIRAKAIKRALRGPEHTFFGRIAFSLRRRILTGTLLMIPIVISFFPVVWLYPKLDRFAKVTLQIDQPGLGFIVALLSLLTVLFIIGLLAATFVVRWAVVVMEKIFNQVPVVNFLYKTTKQVIELFNKSSQSASKPFKKVVWIEYPRKGIHALGFVTGEAVYPDRGHLVHIFIPTTPNPTSGFLLLFPAEDVMETGVPVDQAVQFIISGGILEMGALQLKPFESELPELLEGKQRQTPLISSEA